MVTPSQETLLAQMNAREAELGYGCWDLNKCPLVPGPCRCLARCPKPHGHHEQDANVKALKKVGVRFSSFAYLTQLWKTDWHIDR